MGHSTAGSASRSSDAAELESVTIAVVVDDGITADDDAPLPKRVRFCDSVARYSGVAAVIKHGSRAAVSKTTYIPREEHENTVTYCWNAQ